METSILKMEILHRIYHKKSIWELEPIEGFKQILTVLFEMRLIYRDENTNEPKSFDPYSKIRLTPYGIALMSKIII